MKECDYCGKQDEDAAFYCSGCGTALTEKSKPVPPVLLASLPPARAGTLSGGKAVALLGAYFGVQMLVGFFIGFIAVLAARPNGTPGIFRTAELMQWIMPIAIIQITILGGLITVIMLLLLAPNHIRDTSPVGAAWVPGRWGDICSGFVVGLLIAGVFSVLSLLWSSPRPDSNLGPLTRMAMTPGWPQAAWAVTAVFLAPPTEEMLFRGAAYGGFRKSCGPIWAAVLVTGIFVSLHYAEFIHYPQAILSITALAVAALWSRLQWQAIGPAIAVHVGYNLLVTIVTFYSVSRFSSTLR